MRRVPWPSSSEQVAPCSVLGSQLRSLETAGMAEEWSIEHRADSPGRGWMTESNEINRAQIHKDLSVTFVPPTTATKT